MSTKQNLFFNALTFDLPQKPINFYFSIEEFKAAQKIHRSLLPYNFNDYFPGYDSDINEFVYTSFDEKNKEAQAIPIIIDTENQNLVKQHFNRKIKAYFDSFDYAITHTNFVNDNQIWLRFKKKENKDNYVFLKFTVKTQFKRFSNNGELLISYDGESQVLKSSVAKILEDHSSSLIKTVIYDKGIYKFNDLLDQGITDTKKMFPLLNPALRKNLGFAFPRPNLTNRYKRYKDKIDKFISHFILSEGFKDIVPINSDQYLKVDKDRIFKVNEGSNLLRFKNGTSDNPRSGISKLKPFEESPFNNKLDFIFIAHEKDREVARTLFKYFKDGLSHEFARFNSLNEQISLVYGIDEDNCVFYNDKTDPLTAIEKKLNKPNNSNNKLFAMYISPFSKFEKDEEKRELYYKVKELLLKRGISSQVVDKQILIDQGSKYVFSLINMSVAILAKLKGIPWQLDTISKNELIVGVGAFKNIKSDTEYIGSAFSFDNSGKFNRFEYFLKNETQMLAGSIGKAIQDFIQEKGKPERLIIHFYKEIGKEDVKPIEAKLKDLNIGDIPVFIVTVFKTESKGLIAFDLDYEHLMPLSGTYIDLDFKNYLLFNNPRHDEDSKVNNKGFTFPIRLQLYATQKESLNTDVVSDLISQVYQFSRLYWKSVDQQNLPVTTKYPELLAKVAPHFSKGTLKLVEDSLWFI